MTLWVEPGRMKSRGKVVTYGVPYGARARMILLYLQTQAVRTGSREVALGRSMRDWMERMGLSVGGETVRSLREQASRISACSLKFFWEGDHDAEGWAAGRIVNSGLLAWFKRPDICIEAWASQQLYLHDGSHEAKLFCAPSRGKRGPSLGPREGNLRFYRRNQSSGRLPLYPGALSEPVLSVAPT